jgi:hypothetical protein
MPTQKKKGHPLTCKWPFSAPTNLTLAYAPAGLGEGTHNPSGTIPQFS